MACPTALAHVVVPSREPVSWSSATTTIWYPTAACTKLDSAVVKIGLSKQHELDLVVCLNLLARIAGAAPGRQLTQMV